MTNIDSYFYLFLDKESKENKITKRELLENIIGDYIIQRKQDKIEKAYLNMGKDEEYLQEMQNNTKYLSNL
ncbi:MAG: hypothetical protein Q9M97_01070 [Candidatus Gracilibacteria bacterium]|nr:hypothetical protein [Candidatus Gracilibacteria bacterium]